MTKSRASRSTSTTLQHLSWWLGCTLSTRLTKYLGATLVCRPLWFCHYHSTYFSGGLLFWIITAALFAIMDNDIYIARYCRSPHWLHVAGPKRKKRSDLVILQGFLLYCIHSQSRDLCVWFWLGTTLHPEANQRLLIPAGVVQSPTDGARVELLMRKGAPYGHHPPATLTPSISQLLQPAISSTRHPYRMKDIQAGFNKIATHGAKLRTLEHSPTRSTSRLWLSRRLPTQACRYQCLSWIRYQLSKDVGGMLLAALKCNKA